VPSLCFSTRGRWRERGSVDALSAGIVPKQYGPDIAHEVQFILPM